MFKFYTPDNQYLADLPISDSLGIEKIYTVRSRSVSFDDAMQNASNKLEQIAMEIITDARKRTKYSL